MADSSWVLVDDRDPGITYGGPAGATLWHGGVSQEYLVTTTGLDAGDTATYFFNASSIAVFGTYGPTGQSGPPIAIYQVDDNPATTVTAPTTQATLYRQNFWTSDSQLPPLAPGNFHQLVVTATAPNNTLWVDYLAYPPNSSTNTTTSSSTSSSTFSTSAAPTTSLAITQTTNPGNEVASSTGTSNSNTTTSTGAVVAGIVVGAVAFILATAALVVYMRRRRRSRAPTGEYLMQGDIDGPSDMSQIRHTPSTSTPIPLLSEDAPSYTSTPQQEGSRDERPRPLPPVPSRAFDGGVRLLGGPLEIPPEYQEHY